MEAGVVSTAGGKNQNRLLSALALCAAVRLLFCAAVGMLLWAHICAAVCLLLRFLTTLAAVRLLLFFSGDLIASFRFSHAVHQEVQMSTGLQLRSELAGLSSGCHPVLHARHVLWSRRYRFNSPSLRMMVNGGSVVTIPFEERRMGSCPPGTVKGCGLGTACARLSRVCGILAPLFLRGHTCVFAETPCLVDMERPSAGRCEVERVDDEYGKDVDVDWNEYGFGTDCDRRFFA
eukprot:6473498-Amphidinium_carterae.1